MSNGIIQSICAFPENDGRLTASKADGWPQIIEFGPVQIFCQRFGDGTVAAMLRKLVELAGMDDEIWDISDARMQAILDSLEVSELPDSLVEEIIENLEPDELPESVLESIREDLRDDIRSGYDMADELREEWTESFTDAMSEAVSEIEQAESSLEDARTTLEQAGY